MPIPTPNSGETPNDYVARCTGSLITEGVPSNQAAFICFQKWRDAKKGEEIIELDKVLPLGSELEGIRLIHFKEEGDTEKMGKIEEIFDDIQEGNPTRAQAGITTGQGRGYEAPKGVIAGQYDEIEVDPEQQTPRSDDQDLDELFPIHPKKKL
jgi:hypothetical protein